MYNFRIVVQQNFKNTIQFPSIIRDVKLSLKLSRNISQVSGVSYDQVDPSHCEATSQPVGPIYQSSQLEWCCAKL